MSEKTADLLTEDRKKEIFRALVEAQDQGVKVGQSYRMVAEQFAVAESQVKQIEREGLDAVWPPL